MESERQLPQYIADIENPVKMHQWRSYAECLTEDPNLFFTERGQRSDDAKEVCKRCRVTELCLTYALMTSQQDGTWGGMTTREREALKRYRKRAQSWNS